MFINILIKSCEVWVVCPYRNRAIQLSKVQNFIYKHFLHYILHEVAFSTSQPLDGLVRDVASARVSWKESTNNESINIRWQWILKRTVYINEQLNIDIIYIQNKIYEVIFGIIRLRRYFFFLVSLTDFGFKSRLFKLTI